MDRFENPRAPRPSILVDVIRPRDLVSFTVEGYNVELVLGGEPHLRPEAEGDARLVVCHPYQHLGEEAIYEEAAPVPDESNPDGPPVVDTAAVSPPGARPSPPVSARPARGSRLVFEVPEGTVIPFTVEGILKAIGQLPMMVHRLAKPAPEISVDLSDWRTYRLLGERVARLDEHGTLLFERVADTAYPDLSSRGRLVALARDGRRLRTRLAGGGAYEVLGGTAPIVIGGHTYEMPSSGGYSIADIPEIPIEVPYRPTHSSPPGLMETSIEAPFRLAISPSVHGGWAHASAPVGAENAPHRTELWHSRLGVRKTRGEEVTVDEQATAQRVIRAIWARDRERFFLRDWQTDQQGRTPTHDDSPFRSSLDSADRHMLVRQSSESWLDRLNQPITPVPVSARRLYLSSLGAWLDFHGEWETARYSNAWPAMASILSWDHIAPMGRDQYVRVVYPGYLYPFGHKATLVKVTERKMKDTGPSTAGLYQRKFLVIGEPVKTFSQRDLPFTEVRIEPLKTPTLSPDPGNKQNSFFFPEVGGRRFEFILQCKDQDERPVRLVNPLLWVAEHYNSESQREEVDKYYNEETGSSVARIVAGDGQHVAFTESRAEGGNAVAPVHVLEFAGEAGEGTSIPKLVCADVELPAVQGLSPIGSVTIEYADTYLGHGFAADTNAAEVWASVRQAADGSQPKLVFGEPEAVASDRAGGFLQPNLAIDMLSRTQGITGKVPAVLNAAQEIQPEDYLASLGTDFLPKLFGLVPLEKLLQALGLDELPSVVSETLDRIEGFLADVARAKALLGDAVGTVQSLSVGANEQAQRLETRAHEAVAHAQTRVQGLAHDVAQEIQDQAQGMLDAAIAERDRILAQAQDLRDRATEMVTKVEALAQQVENAAGQFDDWIENPEEGLYDVAGRLLSGVQEIVDEALAELAAADSPLQRLRDVADELTTLAPNLPAGLGKRFTDLASVLHTILEIGEIVDLVNDIVRFVEQFSASDLETSFRYEWKPKLQSWPSNDPILEVKEDSLSLAVEGRVSGKGSASLSVLAELREFVLNLLPVETLVRFRFKHLSFSAGSSGKTEVDVVLEDIEFVGILSFIEVLKDLIPFDGFSDPPYLDVTAQGLTAGYTLELPNVAIGVFSLTNISLGADVRVPFLGDAVTVGFNFCTRESPFALTVSFIGGGGWFMLRLSPDGLDVLELGLEAGASLSVDFGVASGSVSAMLGIYMRLEGDKGSLTGYFRLRGEVEVLCIISASIELYLGLEYQFDTGKMTGRASLTVKVEVFFFSASVTIECERQFAGSNGDPSFADVMILSDGSTEPWSTYCHAFAGE